MFSKTADQTTAPNGAPLSAATRPSLNAGSDARSVLAQDLRITGEITSTGSIEILGDIEGTISARSLVVGAEGRVKGQVSAETVEVRGKLEGTISTAVLTLRAAAHVLANVNYENLVIESGAQIEGRFTKAKS